MTFETWDITFKMWDIWHFLFMISPFALVIILFYATKRCTTTTKRSIGIILSIVAIVILLLRNIEILVRSDWQIQPEVIPFQICHFANFVLLAAFWCRNKVLFAFAFCFNLPAAIMSIVFANSLVNYSTLLSFRAFAYIFGHILIVSITIYAWLIGFVKINLKTLAKTFVLLIILYIVSLFINNIFNHLMTNYISNYFYSIKPEKGTPLEIFFNWSNEYQIGIFTVRPLYLLLNASLGFVVISAFYAIYKLRDIIIKPTTAN